MSPLTYRKLQAQHRHRSRGLGLIDALLSIAVLSLSVLGTLHLHTSLRHSADLARQRSEATHRAQYALDSWRSAIGGARDTPQPPLPANEPRLVNTRYELSQDFAQDPATPLQNAAVRVSWQDHSGTPQSVTLHSSLAPSSLVYTAALALAPSPWPLVNGRHSAIPWDAQDLGDGRLAWKPRENGTIVLLFDRASGALTGQCVVPSAWRTEELTAARLTECRAFRATLLQGVIRFSLRKPPSAAQANDRPLPLRMVLTLSPRVDFGPEPLCETIALRTVAYTLGERQHRRSVPLDTAEASLIAQLGTASWIDLNDDHTRYTCWVPQTATGDWSGTVQIEPIGWHIGQDAPAHRVCRYSQDLDHSGAIDRNDEHPADYQHVQGTLAHQNYLVVPGDAACPSTTHNGGSVTTLPHQPSS